MQLARRYGWPPREIAQLTLAQASALLRPIERSRRTRKFSVEAGLALAARLTAERREAAERWVQGDER